MIRFHALGAVAVTEGGELVAIGGPRQRRLLAMLLIHRNSVVSIDRLAEAVFAGDPTPAASTTVRSYVARVRRVIDGQDSESRVVTQSPGYMLEVTGEAFDVACFEARLADARVRLSRGDGPGASTEASSALEVWRGDAYVEFADEDWARPEAQRLGELRLVAHETFIDAQLACGRDAELVPAIEELAGEHPIRESFRAQLMVALYRAGRQADAVGAFQDHRRVLVEELGLEPTPSLAELERRILCHDPTLLLAEPAGLPLRGYRLGERLGTGHDGTVYAASIPGVDRELAIKVIGQGLADRPGFVRSFESTVQQVASLRHPGIVDIQDYWREPGAAYVVMRRLHGGTLTDRLDRGPMTTAEVANLVARVGGALVEAGESGISHGGVSAHNVLIDDAGEPCLADFGLAAVDAAAAGDDVRDFALLVQQCLGAGVGNGVGDVVAGGVATVDRPAMPDLVSGLLEALSERRPSVGPPPNPYKGLRAFDEADAADYFGRGDLVEEILGRLGQGGLLGRLVLVVGGSGTGKSSLVRAGVLPSVRRGQVAGSGAWFITTMFPGSSPFQALAESLRRVTVTDSAGLADRLAEDPGAMDRVLRDLVPEDGQLLLVIDQFEELFTSATERDRRAFLGGVVEALSAPDSRLRLVATLRADFYDRPLGVQGFGALVNDATVTIAAMPPAELEAAIVEPAERVGRQVERALVAELISAVADEPAALPALQFTLYELAASCPDSLTLAAYRELGEVDGAIASRAESLYRSLDDDERTVVRQLFERLVVVGADDEPTRRRAARTELTGVPADPSVQTAIEAWANARLLSLDRHPQTREPTVEIAHEALLREWPRLRAWIEEDRDALMVLGHLREAAASWVELGRDPGGLYRGARLQVALDVAEGRADHLPALEREFLDGSRQARDAERREAAEAVARQARANRRLRLQLVVIGIALVVALIGGAIAIDQRGHAEGERRIATARELAAAANANLDNDAERSILLALAAVDATRDHGGTVLSEAVEALHEAVASSRLLLSVPDLGGNVDWSPDGTVFVTEGPEDSGLVDVRDAVTGESVVAFQGHDIDLNDVAFSPDGSMLATTGDDGALRLWDPTTGDLLKTFEFGTRQDDHRTERGRHVSGQPELVEVWGPSFSADGTSVAASWLGQAVVRVFDLGSGETRSEIRAIGARNTSWRPDGEQIVVGNMYSDVATVADADSGEALFTIGDGQGWVEDVQYSPDGQWIATTGVDGTARVWRADTGEQRFSMAFHNGEVNGLDWSPDGSRLATVSGDGTARIVEITDAGLRQRLTYSADDTVGGLWGVAFSPDGSRILTGDHGIGGAKVWDARATGGAEWGSVQGVVRAPGSLAFTPDGRGILVTTGDGRVSTWDVESGERLQEVGGLGGADIARFAASPDGQLIATSRVTVPVDLWDSSTGEHLAALWPDTGDEVTDMSWSQDGELLAIALFDGDRSSAVVVDRTGAELARIRWEAGVRFSSVSFSPDGRRLATTRDTPRAPRRLRIWDWERGEVVRTIDNAAISAIFDPTRERIATIDKVEEIAEIWDTTTGENLVTLPQRLSAYAWELAFSADGSQVATAGDDGTIRLWDSETGALRLELRGHDVPVHDVVFSPDGTRLAGIDEDGVVRVWALDVDDLVAIATERVPRNFTDDECRQYLHLERCPEA